MFAVLNWLPYPQDAEDCCSADAELSIMYLRLDTSLRQNFRHFNFLLSLWSRGSEGENAHIGQFRVGDVYPLLIGRR